MQEITDKVACEEEIEVFWPGVEPVRLWAMPRDLEELVRGYCGTELCPPQSRPVLERREGQRFYLRPAPWPEKEAEESGSPGPDLVFSCMQDLLSRSGSWEETGCFHRAAVFDNQGNMLRMTEDISRHNCINRLCGWAIDTEQSLGSGLLCVSARGTASIVHKALKAGVRTMACRSAVTTAAVELAKMQDMVLIGFVRRDRLTVFADPGNRFTV
ncbi:MAG: formate dehydrogenase accessory sulfurtransferase FdhD [Desulfonatronovibrionaceae bacterium]